MLKFCDSFDHYDTLHLLAKWTANAGSSISALAGRNGNGLLMPVGGGVQKTLGLQSNFVIGFAYRLNLSGGTPNGNPYTLQAVSTNRGLNSICEFAVLPDLTPAVYAGNQLIINPTSFVFTSGAWNYIELKIQLGSGGGGTINVNATLHINGANLGNGSHDSNILTTSQLCQANQANVHTFLALSTGVGNCYLDDLYICDQSGGVNDSFLGDVKIGCIFPRQDVHIDWTPSTAGASYPMVNEHVPDDDTTYVFTNTVGNIDTFYYDTVASFSGQILGAQLNIYARKNDEGSRAMRDAAGSGSFVGATDFYLADSYRYFTVPYDTNPLAGAWTPANINAGDYGIKLTV